MRAIGNLLWFLLGGCLMGLAWWLGKTVVSTEVASAARRANEGAFAAASRRGSAGTV